MHGMLLASAQTAARQNKQQLHEQQQPSVQQNDSGSDNGASGPRQTSKDSPFSGLLQSSNMPESLKQSQASTANVSTEWSPQVSTGNRSLLGQSRTMPHRTRELSLGSNFVMPTTRSIASLAGANIEMVRYLICDLKLLDFLQSYEPLCKLVDENAEVSGYEMYIVEQWACDRKHNSCIITFTGNPKHKIFTGIVALPKDAKLWNPFTQGYFDELFKTHARPKTTDLGQIYVSNLSSFPSNLNLVPVPGGNIRKLRWLFDLNENLKRTGCGGRLVLSLSKPSNASEDKFRQLFKTHEQVSIDFAARELVTLVQIGLFYCNLLAPQYVDGLLCNETLKAINQWWDRFGSKKYGQRYRPSSTENNLLSPRTVSAIIGYTTGIRNRIASVISSSKAPKDPFDVEFFLESLRQFQKHEHLPRTMRIDDTTIDSLYSQKSVKGTNSDFFGIVKSTMKEVSGKTYQSATDVETLDIERLRTYIQGARARYLWLGRGERRQRIVRPAPSTLSLGIPVESLSQSELNPSNDFKWSDIARRTIPRGKKESQLPSFVVSTAPAMENQPLVSPEAGDQPQVPLSQQTTTEVDQSQYLHVDDYMEDGRMRSHRQHRHHSKSHHTNRFKKYMNLSPARKEDGEHSGLEAESDEDQYSMNDDMSDTTTSVTDDELQKAIFNQHRAGLEDDGEESEMNAKVCDVDLTPELRRRHSIDGAELSPWVKRDNNSSSLFLQRPAPWQQDANFLFPSPSFRLGALRRSHSFSLLEDCVLQRGAYPWAIPATVMAKHYSNAMHLQTIIKTQTRTMRTQQEKYDKLTRKLAARVDQDKKLADVLERDMHNIYDREKNLKISLADVETQTARLQYETRLLDAKMRDVEEAVETFVDKVNKLEERTRIIACEMVRSANDNPLLEKETADAKAICMELAQPGDIPLSKLSHHAVAAAQQQQPESWYTYFKKLVTL